MSVNDAEGDRGGSSSSRPSASSPSSSTSPNGAVWRGKEARESSGLLEGESKLTPGRLGVSDVANNKVSEEEGKKEGEKIGRVTEPCIEGESVGITSGESRQPFRRKTDVCLGHVIQTTGACGSDFSSPGHPPNSAIFSSTSGSTTSPGETRLTASILFDDPEPRAASAVDSGDQMPAISKAQMKGLCLFDNSIHDKSLKIAIS